MVSMKLSEAEIMDWKKFHVALHNFISNPQKKSNLQNFCRLWDQFPQKKHLPHQGAMYSRICMMKVITVVLNLIFANSQEVKNVEDIQKHLQMLMERLGTLWGTLHQVGFRLNIYSNKGSAKYSELEHRLLMSENVALKFSNMQKMVFMSRLHFANQGHSIHHIVQSFSEHVDAHTYQEISSCSTLLGGLLDPHFIFTTIMSTVQQLEKSLLLSPLEESHPLVALA
ncbi:predicted protein [Chaetoceros tenuissimus]|uniref:Uncharacterized protein n=1 Tax=Chaetoceros tenuissimus TaxID=426638 RepID=A0AAD3D447_9STRA|nr:predicted protein [Chaetoceros tenuissimus]